MKALKTLSLGILALLFATACSNEETEPTPKLGPDETLVTFNLDASEIMMDAVPMSRATKTYDKTGFRISAFRKNTTDGKFYFLKNLDLTNFTFSNKKLTGKAAVLVGTYKFLITYGSGTSQLTFPAIFTTGGELVETAKITAAYSNTAGISDELFLQTRHQTAQGTTAAGQLKEYEFKISGETVNTPVNEVLQRAVARVDVLLVSATKSGGIYTERKFVSDDGNTTKDILDNRAVKVTYALASAPTQMSLIGSRFDSPAPATTISLNYKAASGYTNTDKVTVGNGNATKVGESTYLAYDNIQKGDIIDKGAHIMGSYFFPFTTASKTTTLKLTIEGSKSSTDVVTRTIDFTGVPLVQNKVTLLRVYVLSGGSVFDTDVTFGVEVNTNWLSSINLDAEVD